MNKIIRYISLIILAIIVLTNSCRKMDTIHKSPYPEEGVYIVGGSLLNDSINLDALMDKGQVIDDSGKVAYRDSLFVKFMFVKNSGDGFSVKLQDSTETITYGISGTINNSETNVWTFDIAREGNNFTVPEDGLYFFAIDLITMKAYLFEIKEWTLMGDAVIGSPNTLTYQGGDMDSCSWYGSGIEIQTGLLKYSFYTSEKYDLPDDTVGLVTYLGDAITSPTYAGKDISIVTDADTFSFGIKYSSQNGFTGQTTLPPYDPRIHIWSLIGDAFYQQNDPENAPTAWNEDFDFVFDSVSSDTANGIFKFVVTEQYFIGGKTFKIRADHEWAGLEIGYNQIDGITGDSQNIISDGSSYHNFKVISDAQYNITFTYDVNKNKKYIDFDRIQ